MAPDYVLYGLTMGVSVCVITWADDYEGDDGKAMITG